ncbi:unnamed protein product, partial [Owenia fusiformis]
GTCTVNGKMMYNCMLRNGLTSLDLQSRTSGPCYTYESGTGYKSYIDHILVSEELLPACLSCKVLADSFTIGCGHLAIESEIDLPSILMQKSSPCASIKPSFAWHKLTDQLKGDYTNDVDTQVKRLISDISKLNVIDMAVIDAYFSRLENLLLEKSNLYVPIKQFCKHQKPFWNVELTELVRKRKLAWREWVRAGRPRDCSNVFRRAFKNAKRAFSKLYNLMKNEYELAQLDNLYYADDLDQNMFWHLVNKSRLYVKKSGKSIRNDNGQVITDPVEVCQEWKLYFSRLASYDKRDIFNSDFEQYVNDDISRMELNCMNNFDG